NQNSPLSSLSGKLKLAYSLTLINKSELHDAEIIRKIRNDFAHKFELSFSFDDSRVSKQCNNLYFKDVAEYTDSKSIETNPKQFFLNSSLVLIKCWMTRWYYDDDRLEEDQFT